MRLGYSLVIGVGLFLQLTGTCRSVYSPGTSGTLHLVSQILDGLLQQFVPFRQPLYRICHLRCIRVREPVAYRTAQCTEGKDVADATDNAVQQSAHTVHHNVLQHLEKVLRQVEDGIYQVAHSIQYAHHQVVNPAEAYQFRQRVQDARHKVLDAVHQVQYQFRDLRNDADNATHTARQQAFYAAANTA